MLNILRKKSDFYKCFQENVILNSTDENCNNYSFVYDEKRVLLKKTLKKANKRVIVTCDGHTVRGVRLIPISIHTVAVAKEAEFNIEVAGMADDCVAIIVISGKPGLIKGLDEGLFVSASGTAKDKKFIYVMSEARVRTFEPDI